MEEDKFWDDVYKSMDPLGTYDRDGDGHYDDDERFNIEEDDRIEDELLRGEHNSTWSEVEEEFDDEYDEDIVEDEMGDFDPYDDCDDDF